MKIWDFNSLNITIKSGDEMNKLKKILTLLILVCLFGCLCSFTVSANAPKPADHLSIYITNLPEEAVYADLLIKISNDDPNYIDFQESVYGDDKSLVKEIDNYSKDGYRSFTLHYKNAKSNITIEHAYNEYYMVKFCYGSQYREYLTQYEDILNNYRNFKIALLDKDFKIISVSDSDKLPQDRPAISFYGDVNYDAINNDITVDFRVNPYFVFFGGLLSIIVMVISIVTEFLVGLLFRFKGRQLLNIFIINVCSQLIMRTLYLALPFPYLIETVIFEVIVYTTEFLIYKKRFVDVKTSKILAYAMVANTCSLVFGIILNTFMFG